jgi:hypothetical protein
MFNARTRIVVGLLVALIVGTFLLPASEVKAQKTTQTRFQAVHSGLCMDVRRASTKNRARVQQYTCHKGNNQKWVLVQYKSDRVFIVNRHSGRCLDVRKRSKKDGATIQQYTCKGSTNQQWTLRDVGNGAVNIINRNSGKCVDVRRESKNKQAKVHQWSCTDKTNQQWRPR